MHRTLQWIASGMCSVVLSVLSIAPATVGADAGSPWLPGPMAVGQDTFSGFIDTPSSGLTVMPDSTVTVQGWVVDTAAGGGTGIDDVRVYLGLQDQGAPLLAQATIGQKRDDVAAALGNPDFGASGFTAAFPVNNLGVGSNMVTVSAHARDKGWRYQQLELRVAAAPDRGYADDPLVIVREAVPSLDVIRQGDLILRGYAIDRNMPKDQTLGVGGSGVSSVLFYLDGPKNAGGGVFLGNASLGLTNREATGFGERFRKSGWEMRIHLGELSADRHALFIYAYSAYWPSETLVIVPFNVN